MSNEASPPPRKRRLPIRWLSIAELVGLLAVVFAGLGYWDQHRERTVQDRDRAAAERARHAEAKLAPLRQAFLMTGAPDGAGERIRLTPVHAQQVIQTQTLVFPSEIRGGDVQTTGNPRIEKGWFADGLRKATAKRHGDPEGGGRLPVAITTVYIEDGETRTDRSIYQLGYSLKRRFMRGAEVDLDGLSLARRNPAGDLRAAVDSLWAASAPPKTPE
ncbi:MAG: hypothetical protein ABI655_01540 [Phenylobacterium sp.]